MKESEISGKRIFLLACANEKRRSRYSAWIDDHIANTTVFTAVDGNEAEFKIHNVPPHVLIVDWDLPKLSAPELIERVLADKKLPEMSVVVASPAPEEEHFVDEVVTRRIQFLEEPDNEGKFSRALAQALNRLETNSDSEYRLHFLAGGETLFREGDAAHSVFIVKRGLMQAHSTQGNKIVVLGEISPGEFVGEMAHINREARSATVVALEDCELIEIPTGTIDMVLFSKPAWAQALVKTLSRRLKRTNEVLMAKDE